MRAILGWIVAYLVRWLPHAAATGLFPIGDPDEDSPVIVTANFSLTVRRVRKAIEGRHLWLLVTNTEGINVWCAACGGGLTEHRVIDAIKVSGLADRVTHREVILPALSAPGVDVEAIREETGFEARFGPVYAREIPAYLDAGGEKTEAMRRFDFGPRHRLDMFVPMNFPVYLIVAVVLALLWPRYLLGHALLFWSAVACLYIFLDLIPGETGWAQAFVFAALVVLVWGGVDWIRLGDPLAHGGWLLATVAIFFAAGFDLAGTVSPRESDAEMLVRRLGVKRIGSVFSERTLGKTGVDGDRCGGCGTCREICPVGVFGDPDAAGKTTLHDPDACFGCGACVKQCPTGALAFSGS